MPHIVVFLQNAWSELYAGGTWPRESWLRALSRCRSGKRLRILLRGLAELDVCENTTPIVGAEPSSVVPPDPDHIAAVLAFRKPKIVVCCGKQAIESLRHVWPGALMHVPHPTWRPLTDAAYKLANHVLRSGTMERQRRRVTLHWLDHQTFNFKPLESTADGPRPKPAGKGSEAALLPFDHPGDRPSTHSGNR